ncbi:MAG: hypothetical protein ACLGJC_11420 [Alphaproteobacteria bacterium]
MVALPNLMAKLPNALIRTYSSYLTANAAFSLSKRFAFSGVGGGFQDSATLALSRGNPQQAAKDAEAVYALRGSMTTLSFLRHGTKLWNERWLETRNGKREWSFTAAGWSLDRMVATGTGLAAKRLYDMTIVQPTWKQYVASLDPTDTIDFKIKINAKSAELYDKYLRINGEKWNKYAGEVIDTKNPLNKFWTQHTDFGQIDEVKFGKSGLAARVAGRSFGTMMNLAGVAFSGLDLVYDATERKYQSEAHRNLVLAGSSFSFIGSVLGCIPGIASFIGDVVFGIIGNILSTLATILYPPKFLLDSIANSQSEAHPDRIVTVFNNHDVTVKTGSATQDGNYLTFVYSDGYDHGTTTVTYGATAGEVNTSYIYGHGDRNIVGAGQDETFVISLSSPM